MIHFPFVAVVGMEEAKKSLLYHAIDPRIGGALLLGHRGCAKSTLVRGFAGILDSLNGDAPFVELPLGATEDRLLGSVNAESLVEEGRWISRRGLIEEAHGGVLYVDEINLLPDHLADFLLDSAATGHHRVERDGISLGIESRYILIGTMNPEEGELRPQLADRLAHRIRIADDFEVEQRVEIVARRMQFDDSPEAFVAQFANETAELRAQIALAREGLQRVSVSKALRTSVAETARELKLEGLRAELAVLRTARCAAAWQDRRHVEAADIREAWQLCLGDSANRPAVPAAPPPPRSPSPMNRPNFPGEMTPRTPSDAQPASRTIVVTDTPEQGLQMWLRKNCESLCALSTSRTLGITANPKGRIDWIRSLLASLPAPPMPSRMTWRLRGFAAPRPQVWIFVDASRSTGMGQFLARGRSAIARSMMGAKFARFHLLILQNGNLTWLARRGTCLAVQKVLDDITEAAGKSLIIEGLKKIQRARTRSASGGPLMICSDGLPTPLPNERAGNTFLRLREALHRLTRTMEGVAWIHPRAQRALAAWIPRLCQGLPLARFELP